MKLRTKIRRIAALSAILATPFGSALAGRPLAVDDANVNDVGHGQLEVWATHAPGLRMLSLAPAYAPVEGLEIGALLAREKDTATLSALQAKWRITPSLEHGCNWGAVAGLGHVGGGGNTPYLNGLLTCNKPGLGSVHLNAGAAKPRGASSTRTWGIAWEKAFGPVTPHVEMFGAQKSKPTFQAGLRGDLVQGIQLDGSVGRTDGATIYTVGLKFQF